MDRITVFRFRLYDLESDLERLAPRAATADAIRRIMDAVPILESAQVVDSHCVDAQGFLHDGLA